MRVPSGKVFWHGVCFMGSPGSSTGEGPDNANRKKERKRKNGELLLQALRGPVFERECVDGGELPASSGGMQPGQARALRGRRERPLHVQILRGVLQLHQRHDGGDLSAPSRRRQQGQALARAVADSIPAARRRGVRQTRGGFGASRLKMRRFF